MMGLMGGTLDEEKASYHHTSISSTIHASQAPY